MKPFSDPRIKESKPFVQDTANAAQYFRQEFEYTTSPYLTKLDLDGGLKDVTIIDVRSAEDLKKGHIPGAINVPFENHSRFEGDETEFPELRKDGYNYIYAYSLLCMLSQKAAIKFASLGYPVKVMTGGFDSWVEWGYPIKF